jgi:hypothetical protein
VPDPDGESTRQLSKKLSAGEELEVVVGKDGAVISLTCLAFSGCQLRVDG